MAIASLQGADYSEICEDIAKLCQAFPNSYWRAIDREMGYPADFGSALGSAGYLSALIPEEYCGSGLPLSAAAAVLEKVQRAEAAVQTHGGFGFAEEYDIERKCRETRLYQVAPFSTNSILSYISEHVLGLPRSY